MQNQEPLPAGDFLLFARNKTGMEQVDRARIDAILLKASEGSAFLENELRKTEATRKQAAQLRQRAILLEQHMSDDALRTAAEMRASNLLKRLGAVDSNAIFMHIDLDMFFCAVEMRDNPSLENVPFVVGKKVHHEMVFPLNYMTLLLLQRELDVSLYITHLLYLTGLVFCLSAHSMISTANYIARRYGVRAAMPGFLATKLCPQLVFVRPNHKKYAQVGDVVRQVLAQYDPHVIMASCDEASLDLTQYLTRLQEGGESRKEEKRNSEDIALLVQHIRDHVQRATGGLTCSAGVARSRILAKICSNERKPNGQFILLDLSEQLSFLEKLSVEKVPGIGRHKQLLLKEGLGITTCSDLRKKAPLILSMFRPKTAEFLLRSALGLDPAPSSEPDALHAPSRKSISSEQTFTPTDNYATLHLCLKHLALDLERHLEKERISAQQIGLKIKLEDFTVRTMSRKLPVSTSSSQRIIEVGRTLLLEAFPMLRPQYNRVFTSRQTIRETPPRIRLLGLRASQLVYQRYTALVSEKKLPPNNPTFYSANTLLTSACLKPCIPQRRRRRRYRCALNQLTVEKVQCISIQPIETSAYKTGSLKLFKMQETTLKETERILRRVSGKPDKNRTAQIQTTQRGLGGKECNNENGAKLLNFLKKQREQKSDACIPHSLIEHAFTAVGCDVADTDTIILAAEVVQLLLNDCSIDAYKTMRSGDGAAQVLTTSTLAKVLARKREQWVPTTPATETPNV